MTKKIFWEDPYQITLDARIKSVNQNYVTLDQTIFFAFSGGQESDTGSIGAYPVIEAQKMGLEIQYKLPDDHKLQENDGVVVSIDWSRRYRLMRLHFAAEIVLELAYQNLSPIQKIGAHIGEDKSRIDFEWRESIAKQLPMLEEKANTLVMDNHDIISDFSDIVNEKRYWEITDFARVACGGTHLRNTGEVGAISLKRKNIGKNKERIEIYVD